MAIFGAFVGSAAVTVTVAVAGLVTVLCITGAEATTRGRVAECTRSPARARVGAENSRKADTHSAALFNIDMLRLNMIDPPLTRVSEITRHISSRK